MLAQRVRLAGEARGDAQMLYGPLDPVEVSQPTLDREGPGPSLDIALEQRQLSVPPLDPRALLSAQRLRQNVDERDQDDEQREQQDDEALDIGRDEERQIAVKQAGAEATMTIRLR